MKYLFDVDIYTHITILKVFHAKCISELRLERKANVEHFSIKYLKMFLVFNYTYILTNSVYFLIMKLLYFFH